MEKHVQQLILHELMEAITLARNAAIVIGKNESTINYRETAVEKIYSHLAFALPHILSLLPGIEYVYDKTREHYLDFHASAALDDKAICKTKYNKINCQFFKNKK